MFVDPEGTFIVTGSVALGFAAAKLGGLAIAYGGTKLAQWAANSAGANVPNEDINMAFGGVAAIQAGQIAAVAGVEVAISGGQAAMSLVRANPGAIQATADFVSGANPSVVSSINSKAGLLGWAAGQAYSAYNQSQSSGGKNY